jgi:thioesterase domain-containing protein
MRKEPPELAAHKRALGRQLAALREAATIGQQQVAEVMTADVAAVARRVRNVGRSSSAPTPGSHWSTTAVRLRHSRAHRLQAATDSRPKLLSVST